MSRSFRLIAEEEAKRPENVKWRESFLPLLGEWLAALKTAPPSQRAAGLLAADHLLEAAQEAGRTPGWPEKSSALEKLGAVFALNGIGNYYFYTGNWEKEARSFLSRWPRRKDGGDWMDGPRLVRYGRIWIGFVQQSNQRGRGSFEKGS